MEEDSPLFGIFGIVATIIIAAYLFMPWLLIPIGILLILVIIGLVNSASDNTEDKN